MAEPGSMVKFLISNSTSVDPEGEIGQESHEKRGEETLGDVVGVVPHEDDLHFQLGSSHRQVWSLRQKHT